MDFDRLRSLFAKDSDDRIYHRGDFVNYRGNVSYHARAYANEDARYREAAIGLHNIGQDIWNISTLIHRLNWENQEARDGRLDRGVYWQWASCDLEAFHVQLRSLHDYAARAIAAAAIKPGSVPEDSFRRLRTWIERPGNEARLGERLARVVRSAPEFPSLRAIRDSIVHRGGHMMVFGEPADGILFQVQEGFRGLISDERVMFNENVADFERYAVLKFGSALLFVETLSGALSEILPAPHLGSGNARSYSSGMDVFMGWVNEFEEANRSSALHPR